LIESWWHEDQWKKRANKDGQGDSQASHVQVEESGKDIIIILILMNAQICTSQ